MDSSCPVCSKEKSTSRKYCSFACRNIVINQNKDYAKNGAAIRAALNKNIITREMTCPRCDTKWTQKSNTSGKFPANKFCSRSCANARKQTVETKRKIASALISYVDKSPLLNVRSKNLKECPVCTKGFIGNATTCSRTCGVVSRIDARRKLALNAVVEENLDDLKKVYKSYSKFLFKLRAYPDYFNWEMLQSTGMYKPKNRGDNPDGVSRDHWLSVVWGYKNDVNPFLLSHPANCRLISQRDNAAKGCRESISPDELMEKINEFELVHGSFYGESFKYNRTWTSILEVFENSFN